MHEGQAVTSRESPRRDAAAPARHAPPCAPPAACRDSRVAVRTAGTVPDGPALPAPAPAGGPEPDILRLRIEPGQWALAVPLPGARPDATALRGLLGEVLVRDRRQAGRDRGPAVIRVPGSVFGQDFGALLHHRPGRTSLYCPAGQITGPVAAALTVIAGQGGLLAVPGGPRRAVTVIPVPHAAFPPAVHPAAAMPGDRDVEVCVCAGLVDAGLARRIGALCTAHAGLAAGDPAGAARQP